MEMDYDFPNNLAKLYEPVVPQPVHIFKDRRIDLRKITLKEAKELVEIGFPFLKEKPKEIKKTKNK